MPVFEFVVVSAAQQPQQQPPQPGDHVEAYFAALRVITDPEVPRLACAPFPLLLCMCGQVRLQQRRARARRRAPWRTCWPPQHARSRRPASLSSREGWPGCLPCKARWQGHRCSAAGAPRPGLRVSAAVRSAR